MQKDIILRIVVTALMLYGLCSLASVRGELRRTEQLAQELEARYTALEAEKDELEARLEAAKSPEEMERLARRRLGLVFPGDRLFYFVPGGE